jgi:hypothetical protein
MRAYIRRRAGASFFSLRILPDYATAPEMRSFVSANYLTYIKRKALTIGDKARKTICDFAARWSFNLPENGLERIQSGDRMSCSMRVDVMLSNLNVRGQIPVIVREDLLAEPRQFVRIRLRNQIHDSSIGVCVVPDYSILCALWCPVIPDPCRRQSQVASVSYRR